jgi:hypothetical protein
MEPGSPLAGESPHEEMYLSIRANRVRCSSGSNLSLVVSRIVPGLSLSGEPRRLSARSGGGCYWPSFVSLCPSLCLLWAMLIQLANCALEPGGLADPRGTHFGYDYYIPRYR